MKRAQTATVCALFLLVCFLVRNAIYKKKKKDPYETIRIVWNEEHIKENSAFS